MDFDEQDELRRKRMRFLEKGASSEDTSPKMAGSDLIGDAIKARELELALDHGSERRKQTTPPEAGPTQVANAENAESHERSHPNQDQVVAVFESGEHAELFSVLIEFDENSKYNKPEKSFDSSARLQKPKSARRQNGTGYGGSDDEYYMGMADSMLNPNAQQWTPFTGQGFKLGDSGPEMPPDDYSQGPVAPPIPPVDIEAPKKKKKGGFGSLGGLSGFGSSGGFSSWSTIGKKSKSIFANNFKGAGHSLGSPEAENAGPSVSTPPANFSPAVTKYKSMISMTPHHFGIDSAPVPMTPPHAYLPSTHPVMTPPPPPCPPSMPLGVPLPFMNQSLNDEYLKTLGSHLPHLQPPQISSKQAKKKHDMQDKSITGDEEADIEDEQMTQEDDYWGDEFPVLNPSEIKRRMKAEEKKQEESIKPDEDDLMTARTFARVAALLHLWDGNITAAFTIVPSIIRCSSILDRAAELLRHSTLEEIAGKTELYQKLHDFIYFLAKHPSTSFLVLEDRIAHRPGHTISKVVHRLSTPGISEMSASSLFRCMHALAKMADAELNNADADTGSLNVLCSFNTTYKGLLKGIKAPVAEEKNPDSWQAELRFAQVQDDIMQARHSLYSTEASNSSVAKTRMRRIGKEIKDLRENLPDGIFVRVAESRPDLMKILIIGPRDTPYENGLFEFDLLCQNQFPVSPPKMEFRTTGSGRVRFNPNLYEDGKVCLSLLGTWSGEPWDSEKSTLRQVLVSIQAMIFCETPYLNEPGREMLEDTHPLVIEHNKELRPQTVKYAMLAWLEAEQDSIWSDVVMKHFASKEEEIRSCVKVWAEELKSKTSGVVGTGWAGKTVGEKGGEEVEGDLVAYLKRVLPALKTRSGSSAPSIPPGLEDFM
ncbi:putative ubiquitin-conjugating enzyme protein 17, partial [Pseudocercospora fuligena]